MAQIWHCCGLWLWHRPAAVAPIRPLAWELPYATGAALKSEKKKEGKRERNKEKERRKRKREKKKKNPLT